MKNKLKCNKLIQLLLIAILVIFVSNPIALAASDTEDTILGFDSSELGESLDDYNSDGGTSTTFDKGINKVIYLIQVVGSIISVVVLVVLGIKYMFGSVEERADYKRTMMPYFIGAIMVFGISNVTSLLYYIATNVIS